MNQILRGDMMTDNRRVLPATEGNGHSYPFSDRTLSSVDLFCGRREIAIEHGGAFYRLKITRQGKLILNK